MPKREEPLPRCPACGHALASVGASVAHEGAWDARCPECGLAEAAALAVPRRAERFVLVALVLAVVARCGHAAGLVGPELGWTSRGAEQVLLASRSGAWIVAALAFALLAVRPRVGAGGRWVASVIAAALVATAMVVLTLGIGGLGVMSLPTWLLDLLADPTIARSVGAVPPAAQGIAAIGFSVMLWHSVRSGRRAWLAVVVAYALLFALVETLARTQFMESVMGHRLATAIFGWRLWIRVSVDLFAAAGWLSVATWRW